MTQQTSTTTATDTLRQTVTLTVHDTVRETTTITIQTNSHGDTTRITTLRDRQSATHRDLAALQNHHTSESTAQEVQATSTTHATGTASHHFPLHILVLTIILAFLMLSLARAFKIRPPRR